MQPILFTVVRRQTVRSARQIGNPRLLRGIIPLPNTKLWISGITKDSAGAVLPSCTVTLYRTLDDIVFEEVISNATTGAYAFSAIGLSETYYVVAYKSGSPDVAGTTVNTLVGA